MQGIIGERTTEDRGRTTDNPSSVLRRLSSEKNEKAAEQLHRLLAFGPRIRRGAGGGPDPRLRSSGDGHEARPPGSHHRRGRRMPAGRPVLCARDVRSTHPADLSLEHDLFRKPTFRHHAPLFPYPRPTGSAMKRVWSPDLTRISTARLPSPRASASALRTSAGLDTG